jgi:hypothetical protein
MSFLIGFEAVNTELSDATRQVPGFYLTTFHPLSVSGNLTGMLRIQHVC